MDLVAELRRNAWRSWERYVVTTLSCVLKIFLVERRLDFGTRFATFSAW